MIKLNKFWFIFCEHSFTIILQMFSVNMTMSLFNPLIGVQDHNQKAFMYLILLNLYLTR